MVAAPTAGLVEMEVLVCLGVVLICLACVSTRLPWVLNKVTASVEKEFGPSSIHLPLAISQGIDYLSPHQLHFIARSPQPRREFDLLLVFFDLVCVFARNH